MHAPQLSITSRTCDNQVAKWNRNCCQSFIEKAKTELENRRLTKALADRNGTIRTILELRAAERAELGDNV